MFLNKKLAGISSVEILIVLAISSVIFVIAIGTLGQRERIARDDAARRAVGEIAKVRNEAQQGLGPTTEQGKQILEDAKGELFGQAIEFDSDKINVYKLMKVEVSGGSYITAYEGYTTPLTQQLMWYVDQINPLPIIAGGSERCITLFVSCYDDLDGPGLTSLGVSPINLGEYEIDSKLLLVVRNNTGETYAFRRENYTNEFGTEDFLGGYVAPLENSTPKNPNNYISNRQGKLRVALGLPQPKSAVGAGSDIERNAFRDGPVQYYVNFDLSIPNEQSLEVKK